MWRTLQPFPSTLRLTRDEIVNFQGDRVALRLDAKQEPTVRMINSVLFAMLAGDLAQLDTLFEVDGEADGNRWHVALKAREAALAKAIGTIALDGDSYVKNIVINDAGGDRTQLCFPPSRAAKARCARRGGPILMNRKGVALRVLARTTPKGQAAKRTDGLSVFLVDMREAQRAGMTIRPIRTMMNHATTEVFFDNLRVPAANLIGEEGRGFRYILSGMNAERILIAAECLGDAKWFLEKATAYAKERIVFGRPIGQNQGVQFPIAKAYASMRAAELMVHDAAWRYGAGENCGAEANMAKMLAADASWEAANACLQTYGGFGFAQDFDIERKFRETRLYQVAPISTNLILAFIAEHVLGLPRSY